MYYIIDYWTGEIVDVTDSLETACAICDANEGAQVETEDGEIMRDNVCVPF